MCSKFQEPRRAYQVVRKHHDVGVPECRAMCISSLIPGKGGSSPLSVPQTSLHEESHGSVNVTRATWPRNARGQYRHVCPLDARTHPRKIGTIEIRIPENNSGMKIGCGCSVVTWSTTIHSMAKRQDQLFMNILNQYLAKPDLRWPRLLNEHKVRFEESQSRLYHVH